MGYIMTSEELLTILRNINYCEFLLNNINSVSLYVH